MSKTQNEVDFMELMSRLMGLLTEKEQNILKRRFSLQTSKRETLDKIGQSYNITRERVRQIEAVALRKLSRISLDPSMRQIHDFAHGLLSEYGGVMHEEKLLKLMVENLTSDQAIDENTIRLALKVAPQIMKHERTVSARPFWRIKEMPFTEIRTLADEINKFLGEDQTGLYTEGEILKAVEGEMEKVDIQFVRSVLELDKRFLETETGWGLAACRLINPRSIKDKILVVLTNYTKPMHFRDIITRVHTLCDDSKDVTDQAIHNELIRHKNFVLVGRGMYGLREWGLTSGTVCDVIIEVMEEHGEPMKRQDIIQKVLEKRDIRIGTISLNLQKYDFFERVGRAVYVYNIKNDTRRRKRKVERMVKS